MGKLAEMQVIPRPGTQEDGLLTFPRRRGIAPYISAEAAIIKACEMASSSLWIELAADSKPRTEADVPCIPDVPSFPAVALHQTIAVLGSVTVTDLSDQEAEYLGLALGKSAYIQSGSPYGNPGKVLDAMARLAPESDIRIHEIKDHGDFAVSLPRVKHPTSYYESLPDAISTLISTSDAAVVLGGTVNTLAEIILAGQMRKPVFVPRGFGPLPGFLEKHPAFRDYSGLRVVDSVVTAVESLSASRTPRF